MERSEKVWTSGTPVSSKPSISSFKNSLFKRILLVNISLCYFKTTKIGGETFIITYMFDYAAKMISFSTQTKQLEASRDYVMASLC